MVLSQALTEPKSINFFFKGKENKNILALHNCHCKKRRETPRTEPCLCIHSDLRDIL